MHASRVFCLPTCRALFTARACGRDKKRTKPYVNTKKGKTKWTLTQRPIHKGKHTHPRDERPPSKTSVGVVLSGEASSSEG